jgi:predicted transcriptional regulator
MLNALPEKDIELANKLLDKRQFVDLKELIDSDVYKINKTKYSLSPRTDDDGNLLENPSKEYIYAESKYNQLKELQAEIDLQAEAFESISEEYYYSPEDYDY